MSWRTRDAARQNLQVTAVNTALSAKLITLDCTPVADAKFEFELAGLPVVATVHDAGFDEVSVRIIVAPTELGRKLVGAALALAHSGKVSVGPISIGPGTWNKDTQKELRSKLEKIVNIEQLKQSAASISVSSGDPNAAKAVEACLLSNGGLFLTLNDRGKDTAVLQMMWTQYPNGKVVQPEIEDVTVVHGKIIGGETYTKHGAHLDDRARQRVTVERGDPKKDLTVVVNLVSGGSAEAYLPPSELPAPRPARPVQEIVSGELKDVGSGAHYDGGRNPGCQGHEGVASVRPKHGGKLVPGSGGVIVTNRSGGAGHRDPVMNPQQYSVTFWANTGACETPVFIQGYVTAIEEYYVNDE